MTTARKHNNTTNKKYIRRNRSAYNFFYKHHRIILLEELKKNKSLSSHSHSETQEKKIKRHLSDNLQTAEEIESFLLRTNPFKRRKHRKTHGLIGFLEMTKIIGKLWKEANAGTKSVYQELAQRDLERYEREIELQKQSQIDNEEKGTSQNITDEYTPRRIEIMIRDPDLDIPECRHIFRFLRNIEV